jgi:phospholipase C
LSSGPGASRLWVRLAALGALLCGVIVACTPLTGGSGSKPPGHSTSASVSSAEQVAGGPKGSYIVPPGIHKIKHVIVIMQENRSFDSYFGTYPGADGIPMSHGQPTVCVPGPHAGCNRPYHDTADMNGGGPHSMSNSIADVNGGKMDGFVKQRDAARGSCTNPDNPACQGFGPPDVMGYHTAAEIPNYWAYAKNFVLDDHMFEPVKSWSLPEHEFLMSACAARCKNKSPMSCVNNPAGGYGVPAIERAVDSELTTGKTTIDLAWTDITWLLYMHHVSWGYYVQDGWQPDCTNDAAETCKPVKQAFYTPGIWNPLPLFTDVQLDKQLGNIKPLAQFLAAAKRGTLPAVSWVVPSADDSEHPPNSVHMGQAYTTALINAVMESPDWSSTAIFLGWDDWGGFYDQVVPPNVDINGYGLRVPSITISPYSRAGYIDHGQLSQDAYLKFIEDDFLGGARLDPATDGRPDPRPNVREDSAALGNLIRDFNFGQTPRKPLLLATNPKSDSPVIPAYFTGRPACVGCTVVPPGSLPVSLTTG